MIDNRKTTLTFVDAADDLVTVKAELDITDLTAYDYLNKIIDLMSLQGYHDASILESLRDVADNLEEYLQSVVEFKPRWETKYEGNKDSM